MSYIVDLTLILCGVFGSHGNVLPSKAQSVINSFAGSSFKTSIHNDICSFIRTVPKLNYHDSNVVIAKIIDLILRNCDTPLGNAMYQITHLQELAQRLYV